jgi:hypothetical protein
MSHPLHNLGNWFMNLLLGVGGFLGHEYLGIIGTIALTTSAINGCVMLWRTLRPSPRDPAEE